MFQLKSLLSRVVVFHVIAIALIALLMSTTLVWLLSKETRNFHQHSMVSLAKSVGDHLTQSADGAVHISLPESLTAQFSERYGRYFYAVFKSDGSFIGSSSKSSITTFVNPQNPPAETEFVIGNRKVAGVSMPYVFHGKTFFIQVGEDLEHQDVITDDIVADFYVYVGWITAPILLLLLLIDTLIFLGAFRPLRRASEEAKSIGPAQTSVRILQRSMPSEIRPLVDAFNNALDRLDQGFQMQRAFTADAAHELRTPLAVVRARLESIDDLQLRAKCISDIDSMARVVGQLLDMAELDNSAVPSSARADLQRVGHDVVQSLAPLAMNGNRSLSFSGESIPVWVDGDSDLLWRAVRNLVENSMVHTPPGTSIEVQVEKGGILRVIDDGPGISPEDRQQIFQRFWRRDRSHSTPGAGLGLSIVRRTLDVHHGSISIAEGPKGGALFEMRIPSSFSAE
ncbi:MAG: HAMP domain-containing sensor histidine kinase [Pseudomonadota bacterium]